MGNTPPDNARVALVPVSFIGSGPGKPDRNEDALADTFVGAGSPVVEIQPEALVERVRGVVAFVERSEDPEDVWRFDRLLEGFENLMRQTGLFKSDEIRLANEGKIRARWKFGRLLVKVERASAPGKGKMASSSLTSFLERLGTTRQTALEAQRIGTLPETLLKRTLKEYRGSDNFITFAELLRVYNLRRTIARRAPFLVQGTPPAPASGDLCKGDRRDREGCHRAVPAHPRRSAVALRNLQRQGP